MLKIPNMLTLFRVALIPFFIIVFYLPVSWGHWVAAVLFALAALTDWLDGYLARKLHQSSAFGAFLDPVADKLIVCVALILLVGRIGSAWIALPAAVIVCREILVSALREWMAEIGKRDDVKVAFLGKVKTAAQMISILILLLVPYDAVMKENHWALGIWVGVLLMIVSAGLTLWSMVSYLRVAWADLSRSM